MATAHHAATVVEGFGTIESRAANEIAASSLQAEAMAAIQARYIVARQSPRDLVRFRQGILALCRNPKFADEALYEKPVGNDETVTDFSIRFAEAVVRFYGNLDVAVEATFDDATRRKIRVTATDLENNATFRSDRMLEKTVERKFPGERKVLAERLNSRRQKVYIVAATPEELITKESAEASKLIRTNVMRFVDEDLKDEAHKVIETTLKTAASNDPAARITRLVVAFAKFGVLADKLAEALGHPIEQATTGEIVELQKHWVGLREGEVWTDIRDAMVAKRKATSAAATASTGAGPVTSATQPTTAGASREVAGTRSDALAEKLAPGQPGSQDRAQSSDKGPSSDEPTPSVSSPSPTMDPGKTGGKSPDAAIPTSSTQPTQSQPSGGELFPRDDKPTTRGSKRS
jgi:hypothetical protein